MRNEIDWDLIELLLCSSDLARLGYEAPIGAAFGSWNAYLASSAVAEAMAVAPHAFDFRGDLLADTLLEAAYRVAEGRGVST